MPHRPTSGDHARADIRDRSEAEHGPALDLRALAARFILVGIDGQRLIARRKADGTVCTIRFQLVPLVFFDIRPLTANNTRPHAG